MLISSLEIVCYDQLRTKERERKGRSLGCSIQRGQKRLSGKERSQGREDEVRSQPCWNVPRSIPPQPHWASQEGPSLVMFWKKRIVQGQILFYSKPAFLLVCTRLKAHPSPTAFLDLLKNNKPFLAVLLRRGTTLHPFSGTPPRRLRN